MVRPKYHASFVPVYPCKEMPTRHCPVVYDSVCGERPCARYESTDEAPWIPELEHSWTFKGSDGPVGPRSVDG